MSIIVCAKTSFPEHEYSQNEISRYMGTLFPEKKDVIQKIFQNSLVEKRRISLPLDSYKNLTGLGLRNNHWQEIALKLQTNNLEYLFEVQKFPIQDISMLISTTITGLSIPSLEAKLMNRFNFSTNMKRVPIFGLGCLGGVASIARGHDYLKAYPYEAVLILATELCSLTFQMDDLNMSNIVGTSLFADGAGIVLLVGNDHPWSKKGKYQIQSSQSIFFPRTERIMGWDIVDQGFKLVLSGDVPKIVSNHFAPEVESFYKAHQILKDKIKFCISHPGGPKVLTAMQESFKLTTQNLNLSYQSLKEHGNMSSVSVINVLERTIDSKYSPGSYGIMLAMGPAFCGEIVLLKEIENG